MGVLGVPAAVENRDAMSFRELLAWAWRETPPVHRDRSNLQPFTGPRDFVRRLYAEQFCNFWRFLFSDQWYAGFSSRNDREAV